MSNTKNQQIQFQPSRFQDQLSGTEGQILLGAFKSIAEIGISSTTVRTIAKKAGLSSGIVHYYFEDKTELLSRLLGVLYNSLISNVGAIHVADLSPQEKIDALLKRGLSLFTDRQDEWVVLSSFWIQSIGKDSKLGVLHRKMNHRFRVAIAKILEKMMGGFAGRARDIAFLMIGAIEGMVFQYALDPSHTDPEKSVHLLKELVYKTVLARDAESLCKGGLRKPSRVIRKRDISSSKLSCRRILQDSKTKKVR